MEIHLSVTPKTDHHCLSLDLRLKTQVCASNLYHIVQAVLGHPTHLVTLDELEYLVRKTGRRSVNTSTGSRRNTLSTNMSTTAMRPASMTHASSGGRPAMASPSSMSMGIFGTSPFCEHSRITSISPRKSNAIEMHLGQPCRLTSTKRSPRLNSRTRPKTQSTVH